MALVEPVPIAPLPVAPFVGDPNFDEHADAHVAALTPMTEQVNASNAATYANALDARASAAAAELSATSAAQSEAAAAASVTAAAAAAGAVKWVSGTAYAEGAVVWSPANGLNYRRKAAGAGATDPSADAANWWLLGAPLAAPIQSVAANTAAQPGMHYILTAALTLTLPPAPAVRDVVQITDLSASRAVVINPNGALIRGVAGALTLNMPSGRLSLIYSGPTKGWV